MPEVTFAPINQCTLDDPTDGVEPPSVVPMPPHAPDAQRSCTEDLLGAGGRGGDDCTNALVRRFSSEGGAPVIHDHESPSCLDPTLKALQSCSPLLLVGTGTSKLFTASQAVSCAANVEALVECLTKNTPVSR